MKSKKTIYNLELMQLLKQYNVKCKKTVYSDGVFTYYLNRVPPEKLRKILLNNYSNFTSFNLTPAPVITIM